MNSGLLKVGLIALLAPVFTGTIFYEPRLAILPDQLISINSISFIVSFIIAIYASMHNKNIFIFFIAIIIFLTTLSMLSLFWFHSEIVQALKIYDFLLIGFSFGCIYHSLAESGEERWACKILISVLFLLFVGAVVVKLQTGFWARQNPYFLHGPIIFGRLMAFGLILNLMFPVFRNRLHWLLNFLFAFGVLWSLSKGPILAGIICLLSYYALNRTEIFRTRTFILAVIVIISSVGAVSMYGVPEQIARVLVVLDLLFGTDLRVNTAGTVGIREDMFGESLDMILAHPLLGVGIGNWGGHFMGGITELRYPHNIFLEIFSELGFICAIALALLILMPLRYWKDKFFYGFLFFLIVQQTSGDLADGRFLFFAVCVLLFRYTLVDRSKRKGALKA